MVIFNEFSGSLDQVEVGVCWREIASIFIILAIIHLFI